jgi:hypothetical protein
MTAIQCCCCCSAAAAAALLLLLLTMCTQGWRTAPPGAVEAASALSGGSGSCGAVLVFMPGAPEIDRLVRQLQGSSKLAGAVGRGSGGVRVLPLHGGLPPAVQVRGVAVGTKGLGVACMGYSGTAAAAATVAAAS